MSGQFALLFGKILRSSLWVCESKETRLVWITMLALKDKDGRVFSSVVGLADSAKVTLDEVKEAIYVLTSPDPNDSSKVDEGRRLREISGGWQIVNHELYRFSSQEQRMIWADQKARQRRKNKRSTALPGEATAVRLEKAGATQKEIDHVQTAALPPGLQ